MSGLANDKSDVRPDADIEAENQQLREILEHLVGHFAEKDENGDWWGFDTNVGSRTQDFAAAIRSIKGQNLNHRQMKLKLKYYKELKVNRTALTWAIWGEDVPGWWHGSRAEWDVLTAVSDATGLRK